MLLYDKLMSPCALLWRQKKPLYSGHYMSHHQICLENVLQHGDQTNHQNAFIDIIPHMRIFYFDLRSIVPTKSSAGCCTSWSKVNSKFAPTLRPHIGQNETSALSTLTWLTDNWKRKETIYPIMWTNLDIALLFIDLWMAIQQTAMVTNYTNNSINISLKRLQGFAKQLLNAA